MRDKSCIPGILRHGAIYSEDIEALLVNADPTEKPTRAAFVKSNTPVPQKAPEIKKSARILLLSNVTSAWNAAVATAEAEAKKRKCGK
jgi:hypothetical protein